MCLLAVMVAVSACGPCSGVGVCGDPTVRYYGELVKLQSQEPVANIPVEFLRTGGVSLDEDMLRGLTNKDGRFELEGLAGEVGVVEGVLIFYPPEPIPPVRVEGVSLMTTRAKGERGFAGLWSIPYPHLPYEAAFYHRSSGAPAVGIEIEFQRTGGIPVDPDTFRVTTNSFGTVKIRPNTDVVGELIGDLVIRPLPPYAPYRFSGLHMRTFSEARFDSTIVRAGLGPHLPYAATMVWEGTEEPIAGMQLELRRKGGIPVFPESLLATTDRFGTIRLDPAPLSEGELVAELVVRSPANRAGVTVAELRLPTTLTDEVQYLGLMGVPR